MLTASDGLISLLNDDMACQKSASIRRFYKKGIAPLHVANDAGVAAAMMSGGKLLMILIISKAPAKDEKRSSSRNVYRGSRKP